MYPISGGQAMRKADRNRGICSIAAGGFLSRFPLIARGRLAILALLARLSRAIAEAREFPSVAVVRALLSVGPVYPLVVAGIPAIITVSPAIMAVVVRASVGLLASVRGILGRAACLFVRCGGGLNGSPGQVNAVDEFIDTLFCIHHPDGYVEVTRDIRRVRLPCQGGADDDRQTDCRDVPHGKVLDGHITVTGTAT